MLPSNPDFRKLEPAQAYWYYYNIANDSEMREKAINGSGKSTLLDSNSSTSEFIKAVKQTMGDKQ